MGKRELVIIAGFIVVGALAYQFTAPPAVEGRGFSLARLIRGVRSEVNPSTGRYVHRGQWPAHGLRELRLDGIRQVTVTGEDRSDIDYELSVESTGPDEATAEGYAQRTVLVTDDLGDSLLVGIDYPAEASQTAVLSIRVPARLALRLAGRSQATVAGVAALHLDRSSGEANVTGVGGEVTGTHNGRLTISGAEAVDLTLRAARADLRAIRRGVRVNASSGEIQIAQSHGPVSVEQQNAEIRIETHDGPIVVSGSGGEVHVDRPTAELRIDVRRSEVEVTVGDAVPLTLITTDRVLRLLIDDTTPLHIDAASTRGDIQASEFSLTAETDGSVTRLAHVFGPRGRSTVKVIARNERGDIVLRKRK